MFHKLFYFHSEKLLSDVLSIRFSKHQVNRASALTGYCIYFLQIKPNNITYALYSIFSLK
ncbi:MAG: hypothetical protein CVV50_04565 [Spirochaetae bacterium HGW-Spirochaetae-6]|nr:MAG: hypothetical protein CVV50_04565 [Spirochaetae bacterium HGW-Spirochaetae-6]